MYDVILEDYRLFLNVLCIYVFLSKLFNVLFGVKLLECIREKKIKFKRILK